ncbi:DUF4435 domain-containing protein [Vibrio harveyi]|uniref:DUF4435 domain-containing protein n=1 Tax=Vibrio harveyi TaxID=669 RepID=UPI00390CC02B
MSVKFMEFTRAVSRVKGRLAVFFEGEDEKYFSVRINNIRPDLNWVGINCGGKKNVLTMREKIRNHKDYSDALCMFFVDSDFDDNSKLSSFDDVYITPTYSIENFYISDSAFERILAAEFSLTDICEDEACFHNALEKFKVCKGSYLSAISGFNYLIHSLKSMDSLAKSGTKLHLDQVKFDDLVAVDLESTSKLYDESKPYSIIPTLDPSLTVDLDESKRNFEGVSHELCFRGKQHLEFFRVYLSSLKIDRCKKKDRVIFSKKGNVKLQLTKANVLSELSQYADTPSCLREFLTSEGFTKLAA